VDPFPCTFTAATGGRSDGQCAAAWRAMEAGSVSNFVRIDVTVTGSRDGMPWSIHLSTEQESPASDFPINVTVDVVRGAYAYRTQGLMMDKVSHTALTERWEAPGGGGLYLTAQSVETYAYGHFEMEDVHGTFDIAAPVDVHATF
jgi:hypothetical protein